MKHCIDSEMMKLGLEFSNRIPCVCVFVCSDAKRYRITSLCTHVNIHLITVHMKNVFSKFPWNASEPGTLRNENIHFAAAIFCKMQTHKVESRKWLCVFCICLRIAAFLSVSERNLNKNLRIDYRDSIHFYVTVLKIQVKRFRHPRMQFFFYSLVNGEYIFKVNCVFHYIWIHIILSISIILILNSKYGDERR